MPSHADSSHADRASPASTPGDAADTPPQLHTRGTPTARTSTTTTTSTTGPPDALVARYEARQALFDHVDAMWDKAKADGLAPANDPRFSAVVGLRDLAQELLTNTENAGGGD